MGRFLEGNQAEQIGGGSSGSDPVFITNAIAGESIQAGDLISVNEEGKAFRVFESKGAPVASKVRPVENSFHNQIFAEFKPSNYVVNTSSLLGSNTFKYVDNLSDDTIVTLVATTSIPLSLKYINPSTNKVVKSILIDSSILATASANNVSLSVDSNNNIFILYLKSDGVSLNIAKVGNTGVVEFNNTVFTGAVNTTNQGAYIKTLPNGNVFYTFTPSGTGIRNYGVISNTGTTVKANTVLTASTSSFLRFKVNTDRFTMFYSESTSQMRCMVIDHSGNPIGAATTTISGITITGASSAIVSKGNKDYVLWMSTNNIRIASIDRDTGANFVNVLTDTLAAGGVFNTAFLNEHGAIVVPVIASGGVLTMISTNTTITAMSYRNDIVSSVSANEVYAVYSNGFICLIYKLSGTNNTFNITVVKVEHGLSSIIKTKTINTLMGVVDTLAGVTVLPSKLYNEGGLNSSPVYMYCNGGSPNDSGIFDIAANVGIYSFMGVATNSVTIGGDLTGQLGGSVTLTQTRKPSSFIASGYTVNVLGKIVAMTKTTRRIIS